MTTMSSLMKLRIIDYGLWVCEYGLGLISGTPDSNEQNTESLKYNDDISLLT